MGKRQKKNAYCLQNDARKGNTLGNQKSDKGRLVIEYKL